MHIGFVIYEGLDTQSGGYRYDRQLVSYLRECGDTVDIISLPQRGPLGSAKAMFSPSVRRQLDRPVDVLLQDALCENILWYHNRHLQEPDRVIALVHLLRSAPGMEEHWFPWRWIEERYLQTVDAAICPSATTRDATRDLAQIPTTVAYPSGRHEGAAIDRSKLESHGRSEPFAIAFVGNIIPRKGVVTLLEALEGLPGDWLCTIVGRHDVDPEHAHTVREVVETHVNSSRIEVVGEVSDDHLATVLEQAHVLVVPANRESFGMVYLEAMEFGTVPIATSVGGATELVGDGVNGRLVDPEDTSALRRILAELSENRERLTSLAEGATATVERHDTWSNSMDQVRQFIQSQVEDDVSSPSRPIPPLERVQDITDNCFAREEERQ